MDIDNSAIQTFVDCPARYQERYERFVEPQTVSDGLLFGTRLHQMLEAHFKGEADCDPEDLGFPLKDERLEHEAEVMFEQYRAFYPVERFEVVDLERLIRIPLSAEDNYVGKLDLVGRYTSGPESGHLFIMDHKTEPRNSQANTIPAWRHKPQIGLYQWAGEQYYREPIYHIVIDILTRQSPAGRQPAHFHRIDCQRTKWQCEAAVENVKYFLGQIKTLQGQKGTQNDPNLDPHYLWPQNRGACRYCPYESIHGEAGRDETILKEKFKPAEEYVNGIQR